MEQIDARLMLDSATAATATAEGRPRVERRRRLSPAALAVTSQKVRPAYSPIVIAGAVRLADFVLLSAIGIGIYLFYVVPISGFHWEYIAAITGMTVAAVICFQAADIYQVQAFRGQLHQTTRMISSWAFVVPAFHRRLLLRQARRRDFAPLAFGVFLHRTCRPDRRAPAPARAGA